MSILQLKESGLRLRIEKIEKNTREEVARATIRCFPLSQNIEHWTFKTLFPAGSRSMLRNWEWTIYFCRIRLIPLTLLQSREKLVGDDKNQSDKETKSAFMSLHCNWAGLLKGRLQKFYTPEDRGRGALTIWKWPTFGQNKPKTGPNLAAADVGIKLLIGPIFLSLSGNHLRRHLKLSA